MNDETTTLTCICGTDHTFPAGVATGTCSGCGLGLVLVEGAPLDAGDVAAAEDAAIPDADALTIPGALVAKVGLLLDRGAREAAIDLVSRAMEAAREAGREEASADRDGDPAEDGEPDISDEGFDPYVGSYTDDC